MIAALAVLSLATAHRAVVTTERAYWQGQEATVKVNDCRRRSPRRVTCVSQVWTSAGYSRILQQVTLRHGFLRVHLVAEVQTLTMEEGGGG